MENVSATPALKCRRVLVVEDNPIHQVVVTSMLRKVGVESDIVDSGEAALTAWESGKYDIVLMDVHLPGMDGVSTTKELRSREAGSSRRTPVVAMTAYITAEEVEVYRQCGMTGYIGKPLDEARLVKALETWCQGAASVTDQPDA